MKVGIYPGSFNPWHKGHEDVLKKALNIFDCVIIAIGQNPSKEIAPTKIPTQLELDPKVIIKHFNGLLKNFIELNNGNAIIRGLRNNQDFEFEKTQQYWNEDLGINIPTIYFISDREVTHYSSSALRIINKLTENKD